MTYTEIQTRAIEKMRDRIVRELGLENPYTVKFFAISEGFRKDLGTLLVTLRLYLTLAQKEMEEEE